MYGIYYCYPVLNKIGVCQQILMKLYGIQFHENVVSSSQVAIWGQVDMQVQLR
jgi:hypothetical protein